MALVVDNSVVIGWFISSQATAYSRRVARRAQRERIIVPGLWELELINVLLVLQRRRRLLRHQIEAILAKSTRLPFIVDREPVARRALFDIAQEHQISSYDAAYVELALRRGVPLATQDDKPVRAARGAGVLLR